MLLKFERRSTALKIDTEVVTTAWLVQMFNEKNSVGREILNNYLVLHGAEQYYILVRKYDQQKRTIPSQSTSIK